MGYKQVTIPFQYSRIWAIDKYRRVKDWEQRQFTILRSTILLPEFGGCSCRLHNCQINFENGLIEENYADHRRKVKLARFYDRREREIWAISNRLAEHFARFF